MSVSKCCDADVLVMIDYYVCGECWRCTVPVVRVVEEEIEEVC